MEEENGMTILDRVYKARMLFIGKHHMNPNVALVGQEEWIALMQSIEARNYIGDSRLNGYSDTIFGMNLVRVTKDNCLQVGFVTECGEST